MIARLGRAYSEPVLMICDARCHKAWGVNTRPKVQLSDDPDDYYFLADDELPEAPRDPGTFEGCDGKPKWPEERLNKWCYRECERSESTSTMNEIVQLPDFSKRLYNQPWKHSTTTLPTTAPGVSSPERPSS